VRAAELAERFSVSTRTIYRDVDVLSASGVPVYSSQGANGGISILEDYTVNRAVLSGDERAAIDGILLGLQTLEATRYPEINSVLEKLGGIFKKVDSDWISVDFSPWGSNPNENNKFSDIKTAILQSCVIEVDYINAQNEKSHRKIEPLRLIFKSQAWYLWGFCLYRDEYRTFKISRIKNVRITGEEFDRDKPHDIKNGECKYEKEDPCVKLVLEFTGEVLYRLCDDYDDEMLTDNGDGTYTVTLYFPGGEWIYSYILSFGAAVKVIEPESVRDIIKERAEKIMGFYL
ncbi:MAG: YafY family transcriptional regulator, partial [Oscillospiraceae bacterium]|jgi:predicted DNA-binding transcriptional regulator YafY|nr:YafY family transcriptional regulator [Oscillospiraceae bacterium]